MTLTLSSFLSNSYQGAQGTQGPQGEQGAVGAQGEVGAQGAVGAQGSQGVQGATGPVAGSANQIVYKDASNNPTGSDSLTYTSPVSGVGTVGIGTVIDIVHYDTLNSGTLSWEGSAGQLFSITNNLTSGSIFSVNDVSGIPSIDVDADGSISLNPFSGNTGIGTTNPTSKLTVQGDVKVTGIVTATSFSGDIAVSAGSTSSPSLKFSSSTTTGIYSPGSNQFGIATNGVGRITIDASGNVVAGGTLTAGSFIPTSSTVPTNGLYLPSANNIAISTNGTERMTIANDGVINTYSDQRCLRVRSNYTAGTGTSIINGFHSATSTTTGSLCFVVLSNGNVTNTNGSYAAISDAKLKENIVNANSQWNDLKAIQIRNWNFKEETGHETHRRIGPIAQELEQICPGLVFDVPDCDTEGNDLGTITKGINQSILYMKAVKALQEAMERIETLEAKVAAMETP